MRFTRAAKVAAFPLTALILVALVACQGPAGPAGAAGGKGDPGTMGTPGAPGTPGASGISPIVSTSKTPEVILLNHTLLTATLGSASAVVDITGYFRGGKEPVTYDYAILLPDVEANRIFKIELDKVTGELTVTAKKPKDLLVAAAYTTGETITIKALDADKIATPAEPPVKLTIKANRAPTALVTFDVNNALMVGTQNAKDASRDGRHDTTDVALATQPNPVCATFALCVFTIALDDGTNNNATLTIYDEGEVIADQTAVDVIEDDDTVGMTFSVVESDAQVQASASGNKIMISGVKSTYDAGTSAHEPAIVKIKATDANSMSVDRQITVVVDAAPTLDKDSTFQSQYVFTAAATPGGQLVIPSLDSHFDNVEPDDLMYTVTSSNHAVATPPMVAPTDGLTMTLAQGTATVTVTATDALGQTVKAEFVVRVNPPAPAM